MGSNQPAWHGPYKHRAQVTTVVIQNATRARTLKSGYPLHTASSKGELRPSQFRFPLEARQHRSLGDTIKHRHYPSQYFVGNIDHHSATWVTHSPSMLDDRRRFLQAQHWHPLIDRNVIAFRFPNIHLRKPSVSNQANNTINTSLAVRANTLWGTMSLNARKEYD